MLIPKEGKQTEKREKKKKKKEAEKKGKGIGRSEAASQEFCHSDIDPPTVVLLFVTAIPFMAPRFLHKTRQFFFFVKGLSVGLAQSHSTIRAVLA